MYKFFIIQITGREKFFSTNDAKAFGIFLILEEFVCFLVYFITFTMNTHVTSTLLNTLMIAAGQLKILQENFTTSFLNAKTRIERRRK